MDRSLAQGLAWTGGIRWLGQLASWAITIAVAHLLTPTDYGLVGMATVYVGFTQLLCEAGLTAALLRSRDVDPVAQAQLGGFAALLGLGCCLVSLALAPGLAWFFGTPTVTAILRVASFGFLLRGAQVLPRGVLARKLDFRRLAWIDGVEALSLSIATLLLALAGAGVWSLVIGNLIGAVFGAVLSFHWSPQPLAWPRGMRSIAADVVFGGKVLGGQLAWYLYNNSDFAVVGRFLGAQALGAYTIGWTLANVPVDRISALVNRVTPAYFAALSQDRAELRRYLLLLTEGLATVTFPACVGLMLVADDLVRVLLGPGWIAAVTPLRLLALASAARSIFVLVPPILVFTGAVERNLRFSVACTLLLPALFVLGTRWGIGGVAGAWVVGYPAMAATYLLPEALRAVGLSGREYLRALRAPILATVVMAGGVIALRIGWRDADLRAARLVVTGLAGAAIYTLMILLLAGARIRGMIVLFRGTGPDRNPPLPAARRLLVVSYHFPPDPAVGGLRWQKLVRFAEERGWRIDVIARDPAGLPRLDPERLRDLPPDVSVHYVAVPGLGLAELPERCWTWLRDHFARRPQAQVAPRGVASLSAADLRWWPLTGQGLRRTYYAWLDRLRGTAWGRAAAAEARRLLHSGPFSAIVSCGPPHPPHLPIAQLAHALRTPLVVDLRDPWSLLQRIPESLASPVLLAFARRDEAEVLRRAALVVTASAPHRDRLRERHRAIAARIIAVRNGSDDEPLPASRRGARFVIAYSGSVYLDRDPSPLFRAVRRLVDEEALTSADLGLEFVGEVASHDGVPLATLAEEAGIGAFYRGQPPLPRPAVLEFLAGAGLLVLLPQDSDLAIPAKLFEYVRYPAGILALATAGSATGELLAGTSADLVPPDDVDAILAALRIRFREYREGIVPRPLADDPRFGRESQARLLLDAIDAVCTAAIEPRLAPTPAEAFAGGTRG